MMVSRFLMAPRRANTMTAMCTASCMPSALRPVLRRPSDDPQQQMLASRRVAVGSSVAMTRRVISSPSSSQFAPSFVPVASASTVRVPIDVISRRLSSSLFTTADTEGEVAVSAEAMNKKLPPANAMCSRHNRKRNTKFMTYDAKTDAWSCFDGSECKLGAADVVLKVCSRHGKQRSVSLMEHDLVSGNWSCVDGPNSCKASGAATTTGTNGVPKMAMCARHGKSRSTAVMSHDADTDTWTCGDGPNVCKTSPPGTSVPRIAKCARHGKSRSTAVMSHDADTNTWSCVDGPDVCVLSRTERESKSNPLGARFGGSGEEPSDFPPTDEEVCLRASQKKAPPKVERARCSRHNKMRGTFNMVYDDVTELWECREPHTCKVSRQRQSDNVGVSSKTLAICTRHAMVRPTKGMTFDEADQTWSCEDGPYQCSDE